MQIIMECTKVGRVKKEREDTVIDSVVEFKIDPDFNGGEMGGKLQLKVPGSWLSERYAVGNYYRIEVDSTAIADLGPYASAGKTPPAEKTPIEQYVDQAKANVVAAIAAMVPRCPDETCQALPVYQGHGEWLCLSEECGTGSFDGGVAPTVNMVRAHAGLDPLAGKDAPVGDMSICYQVLDGYSRDELAAIVLDPPKSIAMSLAPLPITGDGGHISREDDEPIPRKKTKLPAVLESTDGLREATNCRECDMVVFEPVEYDGGIYHAHCVPAVAP